MNHKKLIGALVAILLLAVAALAVHSSRRVAADRSPAQTPVVTTAAAAQVAAEGYVTPQRHATLSAAAAGIVTQLHVAEGMWVEAGAALLTLENGGQAAALAQARAVLAQAEANLALLKAGSRPAEIARAEASVAAAQARLDRLSSGATAEQIASARQAVAVAQASLERAQAGPTPEQATAAEASVRQAAASLRQAQAKYDEVAWRSDIGRLPQALQLEQATIEYERALASHANLLRGATPAEIKVYEAQVGQAQAALAEVLAGAHPADIAAADADLRGAQAASALVQGPARPQELAAAEAQVAAARASVAQAQAALDQTVLRAPFAGTIGSLHVERGEFLAPGAPAVRLGDTRAWVIETDDLSELEVVRLAAGEQVDVVVDALPGRTLRGEVQRIQPASRVKRGDVTYTVIIALDASDLPLHWGMTAAVSKR
jgi:HlyD family secretion protein